jgi:hypothetical protein
MAKESHKSGNYIVTVDADNNSRLFPIGKTVYDEYNSVFRLTEGLIEDDQLVISYADSTNWVDDSAVAYTEATLRTFLRENTGFSPASGGSGAEWGDITGTLSTQTDLQSELDDKQDTLVSATNIKTINGTSVLGSGDLAVGGGGASATQVLIEPVSNRYYGIAMDGHSASNLTTIGVGQLLLTAFTPAYDLQINAISFVTVQTAVAGGRLKLLIYSNANGQPNTKLFESATVSTDTTGNKILTGLTFTFNANETYWITTVANNSIQVRAYDTFQQYPLFPIIANSNTTQKYSAYYVAASFNSPPATMPPLGSSNFSSSRIPMITLRKS